MARDKPPSGSLYPRESYVCFFIFLVELATVWSMVALIYNNWIIYLPTSAEQEEGLLETPVMCSTTRWVDSDNCTWWSCMEWCLSATQPPDQCIHLYTTVRQNGSNIRISECNSVFENTCDVLDLDDPVADFVFNCRTDFTCHHLTGIFLCGDTYQPGVLPFMIKTGGSFKNITKMYECEVFEYGETIDCKDKSDCLEVLGTWHCKDGTCREMVDFHCERRCKDVACGQSVLVQAGDTMLLGDCGSVSHSETGEVIWRDDGVHSLLANCLSIDLDLEDESNTTYLAKDCVNGSLWARSGMPKKVNYTRMQQFFQSADGYKHRLDRRLTPVNLPFENDITIYKESKLKMNHEGCSNSLSEECTAFHRDFGNDGRNYTVKSRFPCFYTQGSNDFVAAYFDLEKSHKIYLMMLWIPMIIFVTSCFFCFFCSYLVIVDKQGHMHLRGCYSFFRAPRTQREIWQVAHEKRRAKRLAEEGRAGLGREEMELLSKLCSQAYCNYQHQHQACRQHQECVLALHQGRHLHQGTQHLHNGMHQGQGHQIQDTYQSYQYPYQPTHDQD